MVFGQNVIDLVIAYAVAFHIHILELVCLLRFRLLVQKVDTTNHHDNQDRKCYQEFRDHVTWNELGRYRA
jgi:hypothetical protein